MEQQYEAILNAMRLAPSAHNTQPWSFAVSNSGIDVFVEWSRHLDVSDPTNRQLYVSIGCAIEHGVIAAENEGYSAAVQYFPEGKDKDKPAARLALVTGEREEHGALVKAMSTRRNDRGVHDGKPLTEAEQAAITSAKNKHVLFFESEQDRAKISELSAKGTWKTLSQASFKEELAGWVRSSLTKQHDGMPGDAMGMPGPLALLAPYIVKPAPLHRMQTPEVKQQIKTTAVVAVVVTEEDTDEARMEAGRTMERLWLTAVAAGLSGSIIAASIESGEEIRSELQKTLGSAGYPQTILRIGHSKKPYTKPTPRRTLEEVMR